MRQATLQIKLTSLVVIDQYFHCTVARPSLQIHVGYHTVRSLSDLTFGYSTQQTIHEKYLHITATCTHVSHSRDKKITIIKSSMLASQHCTDL